MIYNPSWPAGTEEVIYVDDKPIKVLAYLKMDGNCISSDCKIGVSDPPKVEYDINTVCPVCGMVRLDISPDICKYDGYECKYVTYPCGTSLAISDTYIIWYRLSKECAASIEDII